MSQAYDGGPRCCAIVSRGKLVQPLQCRNRASVNVGGALYCAVHYPEKVQARQATRDQAAQIDRRARESMHRRTQELEAIARDVALLQVPFGVRIVTASGLMNLTEIVARARRIVDEK